MARGRGLFSGHIANSPFRASLFEPSAKKPKSIDASNNQGRRGYLPYSRLLVNATFIAWFRYLIFFTFWGNPTHNRIPLISDGSTNKPKCYKFVIWLFNRHCNCANIRPL